MVAKLRTTSHHTTQHNTTHNSQHELLPTNPPAALPTLTMNRAVPPPNHCALALYGSVAGAQHWVHAHDGWFLLFGATKQDTSTYKEIGGMLALGGHRLVKKSNNQQIVGRNDRRE